MAAAGVEGIRRSAVRFVVLIGVVSLFADMTYEGARSIAGPFLAILGANGTIVGVVAGLGELIGYALRLLSGHLSDRTGRYWAITIWGYAVNMLAVPLLALAGRWDVAAVLLITERVGKAMRTPPRDVMLSYASSQLGRGWAFGVHEALDQIGAVVGPVVVAGVLMRLGRYDLGFAVLLVPALVALGILACARLAYPQPRIFEVTPAIPTLHRRYPLAFWVYMVAVACLAAGYADFPLIAFHFKKTALFADGSIPLLYALAMARPPSRRCFWGASSTAGDCRSLSRCRFCPVSPRRSYFRIAGSWPWPGRSCGGWASAPRSPSCARPSRS
jgi:Major Facilitator Superfamily